jgi:ABC-type uncharacterized transport system substrate-binding protein
MMKGFVFFAVLFLNWPSFLRAQVAVLLSKDIEMYREAANAVVESLSGEKINLFVFPSKGKEGIEGILERVRAYEPEVIVAVGSKAASESLKAFSGKPMVYLMVVYPERLGLLKEENLFGISSSPSPRSVAQTIRLFLPQAKRVGMLSSEPRSAWSELIKDFNKFKIDLLVSPISDTSQIPQGLRNLSRSIDVLWMNLDPAMANETSYEILRNYSLQNKIPFFVPFQISEQGKTLAGISVPPKVAGAEASRIVRQILEGKRPKDNLTFSTQVHITLDLRTARAIGLEIPQEGLKIADKIYDK